MKLRWADILKVIKTGLMIFALVFCLAACSSDQGDVSGGNVDGEESELEEQQRSCWQAGVLGMFYDAMGESSIKAYPKVTSGTMPFMMIAFAIWLALRILKHVGSIVEESPAEVWNEVARMAFMCLFCGLLASSTPFLLFALNKFVFPIYYAFLEYGSQIVELAAKGNDADVKGQAFGDTCVFYTNSLICKAPKIEAITESSGFPKGPSDLMQCLTCATSDRLQIGFLISKEMLAATSLSSWIAGSLIYVIFIIVKISFVFYLVDSIFRMNIIVIILPFLILGIPFKFARKWVKNSFLTILNSSAVMMCIAIMATMCMLAMQTIINDNYDVLGNKQAYQEFGVVMLSLILVAFLVLKGVGIAVSLADHVVGGGGGTNFQKKIAKLGAWAGKKLATMITAGAAKGITNIIDKNERLREIREKVQEARREAKAKLDRLAGRDK